MYAKINKLELLTIKVVASDSSNINIDKQAENIKINTTTFDQAVALHCLALIQSKINALVLTAKQDNDYVVNIEGHSLLETIKTLDNVNVNAIEDNYHFLLHGSFSFVLSFVEV